MIFSVAGLQLRWALYDEEETEGFGGGGCFDGPLKHPTFWNIYNHPWVSPLANAFTDLIICGAQAGSAEEEAELCHLCLQASSWCYIVSWVFILSPTGGLLIVNVKGDME